MEAPSSILVDTVPVVPGRTSTGVKVYLLDLLRAIPVQHRSAITLLATRSNASVLEGLEGYSTIVLPWHVDARPARVLTQQVAVPIVAQWMGADVLFEPVDTAAILAPVPTVTTMHSSHINLEGNQMSGFRTLYNRLFLQLTARKSRRLIAISKFVKKSMAEILGIPSERIDVVYHGGGLVGKALKSGWSPDAERTGGVLFVSTLYPHKNADQLIRAYALLWNRRADLPALTIVGGDTDGETPTEEYGTERGRLARLASKLGVEDHIRFPGRVSDDELLDLLATSKLMVFPSSLEGFGIPALEAMQAGLPLLASNRTSVPEIVGEGGLIVDPDDVEAMADKMELALFDENVRCNLVQAGRRRGMKFSWRRTASETLSILDSASAHAGKKTRG